MEVCENVSVYKTFRNVFFYRVNIRVYFSRKATNGFTGPVKYKHDNHGADSTKFDEIWGRLTIGDGPLKFPQNGTFD